VWLFALLAVAAGAYFGGTALFQGEPAPAPPVQAPPAQPVGPPPEVQRFADSATDLQEAMLGYEERRQDFDLGRIGCELLAGGYAAADDAFIAMAGAYAGVGETAEDALNAEYERLVEEMNLVNVHFDASGCPRPQ
jgi:hypothetical protein